MNLSRALLVDTALVGRALVTAPARLGPRGWLAAAVYLGAVAVAYVEKRPIQAGLGGSGPFAGISQIVSRLGEGPSVVVLAALLILFGRLARLNAAVQTGLLLLVAGFWCLVLTTTGQFVFAEARPLDGGALHFFAVGGHGVSGHASASTLLYWPVVYAARGRSRSTRAIVAALLISWALLVGATRVWLDMHYVWNVLVGWAVGEVTSRQAVRYAASSRTFRCAAASSD